MIGKEEKKRQIRAKKSSLLHNSAFYLQLLTLIKIKFSQAHLFIFSVNSCSQIWNQEVLSDHGQGKYLAISVVWLTTMGISWVPETHKGGNICGFNGSQNWHDSSSFCQTACWITHFNPFQINMCCHAGWSMHGYLEVTPTEFNGTYVPFTCK